MIKKTQIADNQRNKAKKQMQTNVNSCEFVFNKMD